MRATEHDGGTERLITIAAIADARFLSKISQVWHTDLVRSEDSAMVIGWCINYYNKHNKAPGKDIESIFDSWASKKGRNKETISMIDKLLTSLSREYEQEKDFNSQYYIKLAEDHFKEVKLEKLATLIHGDIARGHLSKADERIKNFGQIDMEMGGWIDPLRDKEGMQRVFEYRSEPLIKFPGDLGKFLGHTLARNRFVSLEGPIKSKKSWLLQEIGWRAMLQRLNVAMFQVGDLTEEEIWMRLLIRAAKHPENPCKVKYPTKLEIDSEGEILLDYDVMDFPDPLDFNVASKACDKIINNQLKTNDSLLRLVVKPNFSITVNNVRDQLRYWAREGWLVDVVIIDYADLLMPPPGIKDKLEQVGTNWKVLRSISQEFHCLLCTATQTNRASFGARIIKRDHASENIRKLAEVSTMLGLNITEEERELDVMRLNYVTNRQAKYSENKCCYLAQCLDLAMPCVLSYFA